MTVFKFRRLSDMTVRTGQDDRKKAQVGQAAIEALVCLLALAVLWVGVAWLGRIQDMALQASHAARYSAFMASRNDDTGVAPSIRAGFFQGSGNQWSDRSGDALQKSVYQDINVKFVRSQALPAHAQVGGVGTDATHLRDGWRVADRGISTAYVTVVPNGASLKRNDSSSVLGLGYFDMQYPKIARHTSILTDAAHSGSDVQAADRVAMSSHGWSVSAQASYRLGRRIDSAASKVDGAWGRASPQFDWLHPWADRLPAHHIRSLP